jgi:hypothetical protein
MKSALPTAWSRSVAWASDSATGQIINVDGGFHLRSL